MKNDNSVAVIVAVFMLFALVFLVAAIINLRKAKGRTRLFNRLFGELNVILVNQVEGKKNFLSSIKVEQIIGGKYTKSLQQQLSKAGKVGDEYVEQIIRRKFLLALVGLVIGMVYFLPSGGYFKILVAAIFGFFLPDILLKNTIQKRSEVISQALPDAVEMLTMCVEAGLSFQQALHKVSENQNTVISTEFARVTSEIQIGQQRTEALSQMAIRLNHPDVQKFVSAMLQVDRLGIPISSVLSEQVRDLRARSRSRARESAQKVPVKILGPVMACFLPSTLIIAVGPAILQAFSSFK